jgi:hypothetical protein
LKASYVKSAAAAAIYYPNRCVTGIVTGKASWIEYGTAVEGKRSAKRS